MECATAWSVVGFALTTTHTGIYAKIRNYPKLNGVGSFWPSRRRLFRLPPYPRLLPPDDCGRSESSADDGPEHGPDHPESDVCGVGSVLQTFAVGGQRRVEASVAGGACEHQEEEEGPEDCEGGAYTGEGGLLERVGEGLARDPFPQRLILYVVDCHLVYPRPADRHGQEAHQRQRERHRRPSVHLREIGCGAVGREAEQEAELYGPYRQEANIKELGEEDSQF
mmetsp:Transcript_12718/g.25275  ORF Transcript_12718/g.25275 Transcript_12718/m.25275 type:complete len:224 (+) Transcript_12718:300-971(+)